MFTRNQLCRSFSAHVLREFDLAGLITGRLCGCQSRECRRHRWHSLENAKRDSAQLQELNRRFYSRLSISGLWNRTENHHVVYLVRFLQVAAGIHQGDDEQARRAAGQFGVQYPRLTFILPELTDGDLSD